MSVRFKEPEIYIFSFNITVAKISKSLSRDILNLLVIPHCDNNAAAATLFKNK